MSPPWRIGGAITIALWSAMDVRGAGRRDVCGRARRLPSHHCILDETMTVVCAAFRIEGRASILVLDRVREIHSSCKPGIEIADVAALAVAASARPARSDRGNSTGN